jgi:hypothetical protein
LTGLGSSPSNPARSASHIIQGQTDGLDLYGPTAGGLSNGYYWINDGVDTFEVYCDMTRNGGGWMLVSSFYRGNGISIMDSNQAGNNGAKPVPNPSSTSQWGKFSDDRINRLRQSSQTKPNGFGYNGNWPWWFEGVGYETNPNQQGQNRIDSFVNKAATTWNVFNVPSGSGCEYGPCVYNTEWTYVTNAYDETSNSYASGGCNQGSRGFGHHCTSSGYPALRAVWSRHCQGNPQCAGQTDSWGQPTYMNFWVK